MQTDGGHTTLEAEYKHTPVISRWLVENHDTPVSLRQAAWRGKHWEMEAGNLSRRGFLDYVLGRNLPRGHRTRAVAGGLLAGERTHLNGGKLSLDSERHHGSLLGSWQPVSQSPSNELRLAAGKYRLKSNSFHATTQGYLEQRGSHLSHAVWGSSLSEKLLDLLTVGGAASWNRTENKMGWFGNLEWEDPKEKMNLVLYQSSPHWFNPRMHPGYRRLDTLENGIAIPGRGEGGWKSRIKFPWTDDVVLGMTSRAHWSLGNDFHFLTYRANLGFPLFRASGKLGVSTVREHDHLYRSRTYHNTGSSLKWSRRLAHLSLKYSQKWGDYSGGYPRPLVVSLSSDALLRSRQKIRWQSRDVSKTFDRHDLFWFQQWNLLRGWSIHTSLRLPFEGLKVTEYFYASWQLGFRY